MEDIFAALSLELIRKIESTFDGVPFPGLKHRSLSQAEAWDDHRECDQSKDFKGRWQDIPLSEFNENQWAIPHLDAHGFIYYLPALMIAIVQNQNIGGIIRDSLLQCLSRGLEKSQLSCLNDKQIDAVREFMEFSSLRDNSKNW